MPWPRRALVLACSLAAPLIHGEAAAQSRACGDAPEDVRGDFELTPQDGARDVARNAPITLRYAAEVDVDALAASVANEADGGLCARELLCLLDTDEEPRPIEASIERDADAGTLELLPREPLERDTEHTVLIVQPGLDTVARVERGFRTGGAIDEERPSLPYHGDDIVVVAVTSLAPECRAPAGSKRMLLELPRAQDDGDEDSIVLEIRTLRAYAQPEEKLVARARNAGTPVRVSFVLDAQTAAHPLCVRVRAIDAVGRTAREEPELCFDPSQDVRFASGCALRAGTGSAPFAALVLGSLVLYVRARRRRSGR
jgi:hypothetical protein